MDFKGKNCLVIGLARSGVASAKALYEKGAHVTVTDSKSKDQLKDLVLEVDPFVNHFILGDAPEDLKDYDFLIVSPGVPLDIPMIKKAYQMGKKVIGEIELAYLIASGTFIGITGTNGKTTTTTLVGEMFKRQFQGTKVVGNIGVPAVTEALNSLKETLFVTELSSFQLETIERFHAPIAAVLNITPDHLNRHKTMEAYIEAKSNIFKNQSHKDAFVYNADDEICIKMSKKAKGKVFGFSRTRKLEQGCYLDSDHISTCIDGEKLSFCTIDEVLLLGDHNIENILAATLIATLGGVSKDIIADTLKTFKGVAHRIERVDTINGVEYYNDSKATNPESTMCAISAMKKNTHLIAGGLNKGSDFTELVKKFGDKIKTLILLGETKHLFESTAHSLGFYNTILVENMSDAVSHAAENANFGEAVLLSPACASWDMYKDFEERGDDFKRCVKALREA